jgi:hypothetical protein
MEKGFTMTNLKSFRGFTTIIVATVLVTAAVSCDRFKMKDKKDDEGENASLNLGPQAFVSTWSGFYSTLDDNGKPLAGSNVKRMEVTFSEDRKFILTLPDVEGTVAPSVEGEWQEFDNRNLYLVVKKSNISSIPVSKDPLESNYEIAGETLTVTSPRFTWKLSRKVAQTNPTKVSEGVGRWDCTAESTQTNIDVTSSYDWRAVISQEGHRSVSMDGSGSTLLDGSIQFNIAHSSTPVDPQCRLIFSPANSPAMLKSSCPSGIESLGTCVKRS